MKPKAADAAVLDETRPTPAATARPKLVIPLGRGVRGKSVFARWACERARNAGRQIILADADRNNQTLAAFYPDHGSVLSPEHVSGSYMRDWLIHLIELQVEQQATVIVDFGGGDLVLKELAAELDIVELLTSNGIDPVAVHLLGPDLDDQAYFNSVEDSTALGRPLFAPPMTMIVANYGVVPAARPVDTAFSDLLGCDALVRAASDRGAVMVTMPRLAPMKIIEDLRMPFLDARTSPKLGLVNRQLVSTWWRDMDRSFAPVQAMLP